MFGSTSNGSLRSQLKRAKDAATELREKLKEMEEVPSRITKKWLEEKLHQYYAAHPRVRARLFVLAADHNKAMQRMADLEKAEDDGAELAELTKALGKLRQSRSETRAAKAKVTCLTSDVIAKDDEITAARAVIKDLKLQLKSAQAQAPSVSSGIRPTGTSDLSEKPCQKRRTNKEGGVTNIYHVANLHNGSGQIPQQLEPQKPEVNPMLEGLVQELQLHRMLKRTRESAMVSPLLNSMPSLNYTQYNQPSMKSQIARMLQCHGL